MHGMQVVRRERIVVPLLGKGQSPSRSESTSSRIFLRMHITSVPESWTVLSATTHTRALWLCVSSDQIGAQLNRAPNGTYGSNTKSHCPTNSTIIASPDSKFLSGIWVRLAGARRTELYAHARLRSMQVDQLMLYWRMFPQLFTICRAHYHEYLRT